MSNKVINEHGVVYIQITHNKFFLQAQYGEEQITMFMINPKSDYTPEELIQLRDDK